MNNILSIKVIRNLCLFTLLGVVIFLAIYELLSINISNNLTALRLLHAVDIFEPSLNAQSRLKGITYLMHGSANEAIKALRDAIEVEPNDDIARYYLARSYDERQMYEQALEQLKDIGWECSLVPDHYLEWMMRMCMEKASELLLVTEYDAADEILSQLLELDATNLWVNLHHAQLLDNDSPCLDDISPVRIDIYSDAIIRRMMANALVDALMCSDTSTLARQNAATFLSWQGYDDLLPLLDVDIGTGSSTVVELDIRFMAETLVQSVFTNAKLAPSLLRYGGFEQPPDSENSIWYSEYQVGAPNFGNAVAAVGLDCEVAFDGNCSARATALWQDEFFRAGVRMKRDLELTSGCYLVSFAYKTAFLEQDAQLWMWSSGSGIPSEETLWSSYQPLPPSNGKWSTVHILGCIGSGFTGYYKQYLSISALGTAWFDAVSVQPVLVDDLPEYLIQTPWIWLNGETKSLQ